jgi:hypothetical protein
MDESLKQRLKKLVSSETPLLSVVDELRQMKNEGFAQDAVQTALEGLRNESETEVEEDRILEVLDFVTGFCPPERGVWER